MIEEITIAVMCGLVSLILTLWRSNSLKNKRIKILNETINDSRKKKTEIIDQKNHLLSMINKTNEMILPAIEEFNLDKGNLKTISIVNHKGGVGKSTISLHLGFYLAKFYQKKVLLVDLDFQGNLSVLTLDTGENVWRSIENKPRSIEGLIKEYADTKEIKKYERYISQNNRFIGKERLKVDIIPQVGWRKFEHRYEEYNLGWLYNVNYIDIRNIWKDIRVLENIYDTIIFDCPPNFGFLTQSAMIYSDFIFSPVVLDDFSFYGFDVVIKWIEEFYKKLDLPKKEINSFIINRISRYSGGLIQTQEAILDRIRRYEKKYSIKLIPPENTFISATPSMFSNLLDSGPVLKESELFTQQFKPLTEYLVNIIYKE